MMKERIPIGIIGAGWVAQKHLEVIKALKTFDVVGITSRTKQRAQDLAEKYTITACYENVDVLIEKGKPRALLILVSEDQIYPVTLSVMKHGLPLFIEKPAGLTPEENLKLVNAAKNHRVANLVGFNRRFYSIFHKGIEIIRKHGLLLGIAVEGHERIWRIREGKKFNEEILSQWLYANSTHTIDLLRFFGGEPQKVMSLMHSYREVNGDQFVSIVEFERGALGTYSSFWYSPGGWRVTLLGEGVTVEFNPLERGWWVDKNLNRHEILPDRVDINFKPGFYRQMETFKRLVLDGVLEWPMQDLEGSYKTMLLAEKITENYSDKMAGIGHSPLRE